jgi:hypothetical protein
MRFIVAATALLATLSPTIPANAQSVAIDSAIYRERALDGGVKIELATHLSRGDRVITILRWDAPEAGRYTVTSAVPASLAIESASYPGLEVSLDGGRNWRRLTDPRSVPRGTTHLRWQMRGEGRLSYRAIVQ